MQNIQPVVYTSQGIPIDQNSNPQNGHFEVNGQQFQPVYQLAPNNLGQPVVYVQPNNQIQHQPIYSNAQSVSVHPNPQQVVSNNSVGFHNFPMVNNQVPSQNNENLEQKFVSVNTDNSKQQSVNDFGETISFTVNGKKVDVVNPNPSLTLNDFIREELQLKGTKIMCAQAGCGSCTVSLQSDTHPEFKEERAINSCVRLVASLDGMNVTTIEGIKDAEGKANIISKRLADGNGTQCGFCSPGFVMNMYSLMERKPDLTEKEIEDHFDGNLCRCTGYRPILSSFKSFANNSGEANEHSNCNGCSKFSNIPDLEDLVCKKTNYVTTKTEKPELVIPSKKILKFEKDSVTYYTPTSIPQLQGLLGQNAGANFKLLVGNTSVGVFAQDPSIIIDLNKIAELTKTTVSTTGISIGASCTINTMRETLKKVYEDKTIPSYKTAGIPVMLKHFDKVANNQVRNVGAVAGNLMMVYHWNFLSDVFTVLCAIGATLTMVDSTAVSKVIGVMDLLTYDMSSSYIQDIFIPYLEEGEILRTDKTMLRHVNSHAIVNAGFKIKTDSKNVVIGKPVVVFGGLAKHAVYMPKTEAFLLGKTISSQPDFDAGIKILSDEIVIEPGPFGRDAYRKQQALGFFYKFFLSIQPALNPAYQSVVANDGWFNRPVSSGSQSFQPDPNEFPVSEPIPKIGGQWQTDGTAIYTDDIGTPKNTLHASFIKSTIPKGTLGTIDESSIKDMPGYFGTLTAKDLPESRNNVAPGTIKDETLFVIDQIEYWGQSLGIVVADTEAHAQKAADKISVTYSSVAPDPILTLDEAIAQNSVFPPPSMDGPEKSKETIVTGDVEKGFAEADHVVKGSVSCESQYHFHMETQTSLVIPQEGGGLLVHSATQWPALVQTIISYVTGIPDSKIVVEVKRCGGGYGGKISRSVFAAAACALAAVKYNRPVKMYMSIETNMDLIGKRHPVRCDYTLGFSNLGKNVSCEVEIYVDGGCAYDSSYGLIGLILTTIDNCYKWPSFKGSGKLMKTNTPSNTSCRGPGWVPAVFCGEHLMEHIAEYLNAPPAQIRGLNFYKKGDVTPYGQHLKYFNIREIWSKLIESSNFDERRDYVKKFNSENRWRKRGISINPVKFGVGNSGDVQGALISLYSDGTATIQISGTEIGQGIFTKVAQVVALKLGMDFSLITPQTTSTLANPNAMPTGGSVTSGLCCLAAIEGCRQLNERLAPLRKLHPTYSWQQLISTAAASGVNLQAHGWVDVPPATIGPFDYESYSAAVTEVELDIMTGQYEIIRSDILFDCGISLNPAGQVEGGFVMGLGYFLMEDIIYDSKTGALLTNSTWEYKPPSTMDIPIEFNIALLKDAPNPLGILQSKASGEPPLCSASSALFALKDAMLSFRIENGLKGYFPFNAPATINNIQENCKVDTTQFKLQ